MIIYFAKLNPIEQFICLFLLYYFTFIQALAQQVWNMTDISGEEYSLGLYHGEETGHLMVYLNESILIIDFKILNDKTYHFYIGHELMELKISKKNTNMFIH